MSRKRLITDSFQVVKKEGGRKERKEAQSPPQGLVQAESDLQDTAQPDQLEILRQFDLSWQYGPCTGITRMQRWERAKFLGLNPPTTVQDLLLKYNKDPFVIYCHAFRTMKANLSHTLKVTCHILADKPASPTTVLESMPHLTQFLELTEAA